MENNTQEIIFKNYYFLKRQPVTLKNEFGREDKYVHNNKVLV